MQCEKFTAVLHQTKIASCGDIYGTPPLASFSCLKEQCHEWFIEISTVATAIKLWETYKWTLTTLNKGIKNTASKNEEASVFQSLFCFL